MSSEINTELDGPAAEITRVVKRSGAFDNIKKTTVDELHQMVTSMMRVLFEQQNRTSKGIMTLAERRMQLKDNIRKGSMYKSLTSYFQESDFYKDACDKLADEVDKVVAQLYPDYKPHNESCIMSTDPLNGQSSSLTCPPSMPPMPSHLFQMPPPTHAPPFPDTLAPPPLLSMMSSLPPDPLFQFNGLSQETPIKSEPIMPAEDQSDMELDSGSSRSPSPSPTKVRVKQEVTDNDELPPPPPPPSL